MTVLGMSIILVATALGSAMVFLFRNQVSDKVNTAFLGFSSGVMIAASIRHGDPESAGGRGGGIADAGIDGKQREGISVWGIERHSGTGGGERGVFFCIDADGIAALAFGVCGGNNDICCGGGSDPGRASVYASACGNMGSHAGLCRDDDPGHCVWLIRRLLPEAAGKNRNIRGAQRTGNAVYI